MVVVHHQGDTRSGKRLHNYGKSPFLMGKPTISMAMFNSFLYVYQRVTLTRMDLQAGILVNDSQVSEHNFSYTRVYGNL